VVVAEENSGWCQNPIVQGRVEAREVGAEPLLLRAPDVAAHPAQLELRTTTCQVEPRSKLYQPSPAVPPRRRSTRSTRRAPFVMYSWLPTAGRVMSFSRPYVSSYDELKSWSAAGHVLQVAEREELREAGLAEQGVGDRGGLAAGRRDRVAQGAGHVAGRGDDDRRRGVGRVRRVLPTVLLLSTAVESLDEVGRSSCHDRRRVEDKSVGSCSINNRRLGTVRGHRFPAARLEQRKAQDARSRRAPRPPRSSP
jgi:hypothetical protein